MLPVPQAVLRRLQLEQAIHSEANCWQSLIPTSPGWNLIDTNSASFSEWLRSQLAAGFAAAKQVVISARKSPSGIRPIPIWGLAERVTYKALVDFILRNEEPLDRSIEAYQRFSFAPLAYARSIEPRTNGKLNLTFASSFIQYIVKTDVTAFYEYIDHEILASELLVRTGDNEAIDCLVSLLAEVQSRTYGIPQLLDSSDRLSDVYIDIPERSVLRHGWPTWRFNDDFRIATRTFGESLAAIEDLAAAMRDVGLTLSDSKTTTPKYTSYLWENFGYHVNDEVPDEMQRLLTAEAEGDYVEGIGPIDPREALEQISRSHTSEDPSEETRPNDILLTGCVATKFRALRRAFGQLIRAGVPDGLPHVIKIISYVPALTPWALRYVVKAGEQQPDQAASVIDGFVQNVSLSDWQRIWITRSISDLNLLDSASAGEQALRLSWTENLRRTRHNPAVSAEAALALSTSGLISFSDLDYGLRDEPTALHPWYLEAIRRLYSHQMVTVKEYRAVRGEGGLFSAMLPSESS